MAFPQGINFRGTAGYVTDGTDEYGETASGTLNYPTTSTQGNSVGWESGTSGASPANRNSGNNRRIAGMAHTNGPAATVMRYRIDLPSSGDYKFRAAVGDANYSSNVYLELEDTSSSLGTLATSNTSGSNNFRDAADAQYSAANWPGSNSLSAAKTFTTTICRFVIGDGVETYTRIAHIYVESAGGATTYPMYAYAQQ